MARWLASTHSRRRTATTLPSARRSEEMSKTRKFKRSPHTFDDFLEEEGIYEAVQTTAMRRVLAMQLAEVMNKRNLTRVAMARILRISHVQVDRLLDPGSDGGTIPITYRAGKSVGKLIRQTRRVYGVRPFRARGGIVTNELIVILRDDDV